jgi:tetratricopeptide (TPR) repeat protein
MNRQQRRTEMKQSRQPQALLSSALGHHKAGRLGEAERLYRQLLAAEPRHADATHLLGVAAYQSERPHLACELISRAITLKPMEATYHCNLGLAQNALGLAAQAITSFRRAIEMRPNYKEACNSLGNALASMDLLEDAAAAYRRAIDLDPAWPDPQFNLGITLKEQGELEEAADCYRRAIELRPRYQEAYYNLGNAFRDLRRLEEAVEAYRAAIALRPDFPDAHHNAALALLALGDLPAGWAEYEWRWKTPQMSAGVRQFAKPLWRGEALEGRTLLIHAEQGFGDTVQFCRFTRLAEARGARVILEVQPALIRLLVGLKGAAEVVAQGQDLPEFDLHCPMLSVPLALGTTMETIPAEPSYLKPDPALVAAWRVRMEHARSAEGGAAPAPDRFDLVPSGSGARTRIGLVWAGKPSNLSDARRSIAPERMAPLFRLPGLSFFSLQKDGPRAPSEFAMTDLMREAEDFADTAALIANLDLVISVDTAVAHLAAATGKPVWLLDRFDACWRWLTGRRDSPWYPGLKIYRQKRPGDWDTVLTEVADDLRRDLTG